MFPKPCAYCRHLYVPRGDLLSRKFCFRCSHLCEKTALKVQIYLKQNPSASFFQACTHLGIPQIFMELLSHQQQPIPALPNKKASGKFPCQLCQRVLQAHEETYCDPCRKVLDNKIPPPTHHNNGSSNVLTSFNQPWHQVHHLKHHHGFGRSI